MWLPEGLEDTPFKACLNLMQFASIEKIGTQYGDFEPLLTNR